MINTFIKTVFTLTLLILCYTPRIESSGAKLGGHFNALNNFRAASLIFSINADSAYDYTGERIPFSLVKAALDSACSDWNSVSEYTGIILAIRPEPFDGLLEAADDGVNLIYFKTRRPGYPGEAFTWLDEIKREVRGADIELTSHSVWSTSTPCSPYGYDLWSIAAHELGHCLNLGHTDTLYCTANTMYQRVARGSIDHRYLTLGDMAGAVYVSGKCSSGTLPFTQVWTLCGDNRSEVTAVPLSGNVYISSGDSLLIDNFTHVTLGDHDIVSTGGYVGLVDQSQRFYNMTPYVAVMRSDHTIKGFYHSLQSAIDSLHTGGTGAYICIGNDYTIDPGTVLEIPAGITMKFEPAAGLDVEGTLVIGEGVALDKKSSGNWGGITVHSPGALRVTGGITIRNANVALTTHSSEVYFPGSSVSFISGCAPYQYGWAMKIYNCSPLIRSVHFSNTAAASQGRAIYVGGSAACPFLANLTIDGAYYGLTIGSTSDAILKNCLLRNPGGHCIRLDYDDLSSGGVDLSWAQTDIYPDTSRGKKALYNSNPRVNVKVYNTWWGSSAPDLKSIFVEPDSVSYMPLATGPFHTEAEKTSPGEKNPFHSALDCEQAGAWDRALGIYYDILHTSRDFLSKRMAVKQILKATELSGNNFTAIREEIVREMPL